MAAPWPSATDCSTGSILIGTRLTKLSVPAAVRPIQPLAPLAGMAPAIIILKRI